VIVKGRACVLGMCQIWFLGKFVYWVTGYVLNSKLALALFEF